MPYRVYDVEDVLYDVPTSYGRYAESLPPRHPVLTLRGFWEASVAIFACGLQRQTIMTPATESFVEIELTTLFPFIAKPEL